MFTLETIATLRHCDSLRQTATEQTNCQAAAPATPATPATSVANVAMSHVADGGEAARRQVLADLQANPSAKRAFFSRVEDGALIITLGIRGVGTCELLIPAERFDSSKLADYAALLECFAVTGA
jgi:hypothetical protein